MRKILIVLTVLTMVLVPLACAAGEELRETNEETGYTLVFRDEAGLVDAVEQEKVMEAMRPVLEYANVGFMTYPAGGSSQNSATKAQKWGGLHDLSGGRKQPKQRDEGPEMGRQHLREQYPVHGVHH